MLGNHHTKTLKILTKNLNNRTRYRTGICIITGHIGLNKHLRRINRSDTSNCPNCTDTEETVAHYMGQCPAYSRIRGDTLGTYYDSINNIKDNNNIDLIINFALKTKRHTHPHTIHPLTHPHSNPIHHHSSIFTHPHPRRLVCTEPGTIPLRDNPHVDLGPGSLLYMACPN